ncbi:hypothetical protein AVEN_23191-1, partial [Araneus ventricosus]
QSELCFQNEPDSTEDSSSCWCGAEFWKGGCPLRSRSRRITAVQNNEVCPKPTLVLIHNGR